MLSTGLVSIAAGGTFCSNPLKQAHDRPPSGFADSDFADSDLASGDVSVQQRLTNFGIGALVDGDRDRVVCRCGGGDYRGMGMAWSRGPDAALALFPGAEGPLHLLCSFPRPPGPVRAGYSDRSETDFRGFSAAQSDHGLRAHLFHRSRA